MRRGTEAILSSLRRQRALRVTQQHLSDLADDVVSLGKRRFVEAAVGTVCKSRELENARATDETDPLLSLMGRYRKDSGLTTAEFIKELHRKLERKLGAFPAKSVLASAPKYLAYLRQQLGTAEIEAGFAEVLADFG